ncbi:hypothetical protein [uncultured Bifidobacterium sp.]|uniref:hypothetical protein n=1 Tax=uncultured Bifidobacterium sp. TaxID=165187 RepID=UPI0026042C46|nr:hypothetical protein [uncultured Bifidobacterium sp.]
MTKPREDGTGQSDHGFRRTSGDNSHDGGAVVETIIGMLSAGVAIDACARALTLPADFVRMVERHAIATGRLSGNRPSASPCSLGSCSPDPHSLVCAGCPLLPRSRQRPSSLRRICRSAIGRAKRAWKHAPSDRDL